MRTDVFAGFITATWVYDGRAGDPDMTTFIEHLARKHHYKLQVSASPLTCMKIEPAHTPIFSALVSDFSIYLMHCRFTTFQHSRTMSSAPRFSQRTSTASSSLLWGTSQVCLRYFLLFTTPRACTRKRKRRVAVYSRVFAAFSCFMTWNFLYKAKKREICFPK